MDAESIQNASASVSASSSATATPSKGLLSFNTSNITRIFRNSTNFVQSTFGNTLSSQLASDGSGTRTVQSSNCDLVEQTFTIPSIKKRHDASNSTMHHPKKDILSTPVLIMPTAMTNTSSLSNLSSAYKQRTMLEQPASSTMGGCSNTTNSLKQNKTPSNVVRNNVIVIISTADDNHKMSSSLHAQPTISHVTESNDNNRNPNAQFNLSEKIQPQNDMKNHSNSRIKKTSTNNTKTATLSPSQRQPSGAKSNNNANILFETVKVSKQQIITSTPLQSPSSTSSSSSAKMKIQSSSMLPSHDMNNKKDEINHSEEWKNTVTPAITKSIPNQMDNSLLENEELFRSQINKNGHISLNGGNTESEQKQMNVSSNYMKTKTPSTLIANDTNPNSNVNSQQMTNHIQMKNDAKAHIQSMSHITQKSTHMSAQIKNDNAMKDDGISKCGIDTSDHKMSNNNLDMAIVTSTKKNPFRSNENRLSSKSGVMENLTTTMSTTTAGVENIYAHCVTQPNVKISKLDNYKQQDSNENVITACDLIDAASDGTVGSNNNNDSTTNNIHTNINSSNVRNNNNNASPINQMNTMLLPSDKENNSQATKTNDIWTTESQTTTKTTTNFMLSNLNVMAPTPTDLYDILEESDDDEHSSKLQYNRWSSTCSLYEPNNDTNFISPSSFAAAIAFANRNPFLQLDSTANIIEPFTATTSTSTIASETIYSNPNYGLTMQTSSSSSTPSTNNYFTPTSTLTLSNCANTIPSHFPYESYQSFVNDFIDETDFHFNGISSVSETCTTENQISDDVMNTILCILKEYGKDDIKEFMQVIFQYTKRNNNFQNSMWLLRFWIGFFFFDFPQFDRILKMFSLRKYKIFKCIVITL